MSEDHNEVRVGQNGGRSAPSGLSQSFAVAKYELRNHLRSRSFLITLAAVVLGGLAASLLLGYSRSSGIISSPLSLLSHWVKYSFLFIIAVPASLLGGSAISMEFQNKTGYSMVGNPIGRSSIWLGKVLAALAGCLLALCLLEVVLAADLLYFFGPSGIIPIFWESFLFLGVGIAGGLGVAFFFSAAFKNSSISVLLSAFLLIIGIDLFTIIFVTTNIEPWPMFDYGEQIILNVFKSPFPAHEVVREIGVAFVPGQQPFTGRVVYSATIPEGLAIMAAYFIVGMMASLIIFRRREFA